MPSGSRRRSSSIGVSYGRISEKTRSSRIRAGDQLRVLGAEVEDDQGPLGRIGYEGRALDCLRLRLTHPALRVALMV